MISILIPTYNYSVYPLVEALHKQASSVQIEFEIKVYDDGSSQFQLENEIINDFPFSTYIKFQENRGRTAIRSLMAKEAKYEWLLFLDADVLPKNDDFIKRYIEAILGNKSCDVIFGGISYEKEKPPQEKMLRWKYGQTREAKSVTERKKEKYFIISQNLAVKKHMFLKSNTLLENYYGLDNFFSNQLKRMDAKVLHIDNPIIHFGLEANTTFIQKALKAVETTVILERKGMMDPDMRPIQKSYLNLERFHLLNIFITVISKYKPKMERNFNSKNPNLLWFDLYRLNYYIELKQNKNA